MIVTCGEPLPRTRGGCIKRFEIYLSSNLASREVIVELYRVLELGNKARYDPSYNPTVDDVEYVLTTFNELGRSSGGFQADSGYLLGVHRDLPKPPYILGYTWRLLRLGSHDC